MKRRRGANTIEFALTLPVFVVLLAAVVDYGWYFFGVAMGEMAVHRGCRAGATVDPVRGNPHAAVVAEMGTWLGAIGTSCGEATCATRQEGDLTNLHLVCEVHWDYDGLLGVAPTPPVIHRLASAHQSFQRRP